MQNGLVIEPAFQLSPAAVLARNAAHSPLLNREETERLRILAEREAAEAGLPAIGSKVQSADGMAFVVDGFYRTGSPHRFERRILELQGQHALPGTAGSPSENEALDALDSIADRPGDDLFPVLIPQNPSERLGRLISEADLCMPLSFLILGTFPDAPGRACHTFQHSIDYLSGDRFAPIFTDVSDLYETTLAHEIGHAYLHYVLGIEDLRLYRNMADTAAFFHTQAVQSLIHDFKVNRLIHERGFDLRIIGRHLTDALYTTAAGASHGARPANAWEATFTALALTQSQTDPEVFDIESDQRAYLQEARLALAWATPELLDLSDELGEVIRSVGWDSSDQVQRAVDEVLERTFRFCGREYVPERDLITTPRNENDLDKFPDFLPRSPAWVKYAVNRQFITKNLPSDLPFRIREDAASKAVEIILPNAEQRLWRRSPRFLPGAPMPDPRNPRFMAQIGLQAPHLEHLHSNGEPIPPAHGGGFEDSAGISGHTGPGRSATDPSPAGGGRPEMTNNNTPPKFPTAPPGWMGSWPPGSRRFYLPGLARFLSSVRLAEAMGLPESAFLSEHPYAYAENNPINNIDPSGLAPQPAALTFGVEGVAVASIGTSASVSMAARSSTSLPNPGPIPRPGGGYYVFCGGARLVACKQDCARYGGIHWCTETYINGRFAGHNCECWKPQPRRCTGAELLACQDYCLRTYLGHYPRNIICSTCWVDPGSNTPRFGCSYTQFPPPEGV